MTLLRRRAAARVWRHLPRRERTRLGERGSVHRAGKDRAHPAQIGNNHTDIIGTPMHRCDAGTV
ncbi:hypothetical protein ST27_19610 [Xanthomonas phaseoli pv. phaseoli]|nr:hypothetical protein ST27_19610 [Xanthomonas phaseoli pv. phaseoli]